jgi:hypothetical protein
MTHVKLKEQEGNNFIPTIFVGIDSRTTEVCVNKLFSLILTYMTNINYVSNIKYSGSYPSFY